MRRSLLYLAALLLAAGCSSNPMRPTTGDEWPLVTGGKSKPRICDIGPGYQCDAPECDGVAR